MNARGIALVVCSVVIAFASRAGAIESKSNTKAAAKEATVKALAAEANGDLESRTKFLAEAAAADPNSAAHALQGKVRAKGQWLNIDDAAEKLADMKAIRKYEALREKMADTPAAHWSMAETCRIAKLPDQAKAHMNRVLELDPNNDLARTALGFRKIGGLWVSPEQIAINEAQAAAEKASVAKYGKKMRELLADLKSNDKRVRAKGKNELLDLRNPDSILAAEKLLSPSSEGVALVVLDYLANISDTAATMSLARHAVSHFSDEVRREAAHRLHERDLHDYAPALLDMLSGPIESQLQPVYGRNGQMRGSRQVFVRETRTQNQLLVMDSEVVRPTIEVANPQQFAEPGQRARAGRTNELEAAVGRMLQERENQWLDNLANMENLMEGKSREDQVRIQNLLITQTNDRVMRALSIAAEVESPATPQAWWKWYDDEVGLVSTGNKYTTASRVYNQRASYASNEFMSQFIPSEGIISGECFVAGTLVTTHRGQVAIETVQLGDMVLSKNITTGALEFKPVLQRTVRPVEELTSIRAGDDQMQCTRGHFFWVSGKGWTKAEDLKQGMVLHAAANPIKVDEVKKEGRAETYNLRIADNPNYFVGKSRILSHDVTPRTPTREVIPGYIAP